MYDVTQFAIPAGLFHKYMVHEGIIGKGRDFLTGTPCVLHLYTDPENKRKYALQQYQNVSNDFMNSKTDAVVKSATSQSLPNYCRAIITSSRKRTEGFELSIIYDVGDLYGMSLQNYLTLRIKNGEVFKEQEVMQFLSEILDCLYFGGSKHGEYLEVTPTNIFFKLEPKYKYRYFPTNFGLNFQNTKWQKKYHTPSKMKSLEDTLSQSIFITGMVALQMCTLQDPKLLYSEDSRIDQKMLSKTLEAIKLNFSGGVYNLIVGMCQVDQAKRITLKQLYDKDSYLIKYRKVEYFQGKSSSFKRINALMLPNEEIECFAETTNDKMEFYRGSFANGKYDGYGVLEKTNQTMCIGEFSRGDFRYGICILRNHCVLLGTFDNGNPVRIVQFMLNVYGLTSNDKSLLYYGKMNCKFEREQGRLLESDGTTYEGQFVNGRKVNNKNAV